MEKVVIVIGETDWQFLSKEDNLCEVVNIKTKEEWKGFIMKLSSKGVYLVELREEIEGK